MSTTLLRIARRAPRLGLGLALGLATAAGAQEPPAPGAAAPAGQEAVQALIEEAGAAVRMGDLEKAMTSFRRVLDLQPENHRVRFELARVLAFLNRFEESAQEFGAVVEAMPENGAARRGEATALIFLQRYAEARQKLELGLSALPRDGQIAHTLARLVATAPDDEVRDGPLAVLLARMVREVRQIYATGETLAMAYAEVGDFERAIATQEELLAEAERNGDEEWLEPLRLRLESYRRGEAWRAESPAEIAMATEP